MKLTREGLSEAVKSTTCYPVSTQTLRDMENQAKPYSLPRRWQPKAGARHSSCIEAVAETLGVPVGYFLDGFDQAVLQRSCFWPMIESADIRLEPHEPRSSQTESFNDFLARLPTSEEELLRLPWHIYLNERAFAVIFRLERVFDRVEMLLVNEPPLIFWDDEDVTRWMDSMLLQGADAKVFQGEFEKYRDHFRNLVSTGRKAYKVVMNRDNFAAWLGRKGADQRREQLTIMRRFNRVQNFELALLKTEGSVQEAEIVSRYSQIPGSYDGTLAVQIVQTPPHEGPTEYSVTPLPAGIQMIQRQRERIERAWQRAVDQTTAEAQAASNRVHNLRDATDYVLEVLGKGK